MRSELEDVLTVVGATVVDRTVSVFTLLLLFLNLDCRAAPTPDPLLHKLAGIELDLEIGQSADSDG